MSSSESEDNFIEFGTPLEPLEEGKKPAKDSLKGLYINNS